MSTENKKSIKWIIIGCIIFVLAILVAVGPILITKYMRAKWQEAPKYKMTPLMMEISGTLKQSQDNKIYLKGDNNLYYVLENIKEEIYERLEQHCSVLGKMKMPKENETIDGNRVRLILDIKRVTFDDSTQIANIDDNDIRTKEKDEELKRKSLAKTQLRLEVNGRLNKPILFDVIKGKVSVQNRKTLNDEDVEVTILTDEFGDSYMLYKKGVNFDAFKDMDIICLGRDILPLKNMPLVMDEITFEIYEIYDFEYKRLI